MGGIAATVFGGRLPLVPGSVVFLLALVAVYLFVVRPTSGGGTGSSRQALTAARNTLRRAETDLGESQRESAERADRITALEESIRRSMGDADVQSSQVQTAARDVEAQASRLGEAEWVQPITGSLPDPRQPRTSLDDRYQQLSAMGQRLQELASRSAAHQSALDRLIGLLREAGLETEGIRQAVSTAPATALPSLGGALEGLAQQYSVDPEAKQRLLAEINRTRDLCNRQIMDAVARRIPLSFLDAARDMLDDARTVPELRANQEIADRMLNEIYRHYFPRTSRSGQE